MISLREAATMSPEQIARAQAKEEIRAMAFSLLDFLEDPPEGCCKATQIVLQQGLWMLREDVQRGEETVR